MKWLFPLYVGVNAEDKKEKIVSGIKLGKPLINSYVLTLPACKANQLDIIPAIELMQPYYKNHELVIVGIANGKTDAINLVSKIALEATSKLGKADILSYLKTDRMGD